VLDIDRAIPIKEDEPFARELAGGEDEDEGRGILLPLEEEMVPTSRRCSGGEGTASCNERAQPCGLVLCNR
jgi:hypothetical protein